MRILGACVALAIATPSAWADAETDCFKGNVVDVSVRGCTSLIMANPQNSRAYYARGIGYYSKGDMARAIADYTKAIEISPTYANAYSNRGGAYLSMKAYDRAIGDFTSALSIDPKLAQAYHNRASAYYAKGDTQRAIPDLRNSLRYNPNDQEASDLLTSLGVSP